MGAAVGIDAKDVKWVGGILGGAVGLYVLLKFLGVSEGPQATVPPGPVSTPEPPQPAKRTYSKEQIETARVLLDAVKANHHVFEDAGDLVVEMKGYVEDRNVLLAFVRRVADADCVLHGGPRNIYYYDPSMKRIAQADPVFGIRLVD